jgi:hypothetical protein
VFFLIATLRNFTTTKKKNSSSSSESASSSLMLLQYFAIFLIYGRVVRIKMHEFWNEITFYLPSHRQLYKYLSLHNTQREKAPNMPKHAHLK